MSCNRNCSKRCHRSSRSGSSRCNSSSSGGASRGNVSICRSPKIVFVFKPEIKDNNVAVAIGSGDAKNEVCCESGWSGPERVKKQSVVVKQKDSLSGAELKLEGSEAAAYIRELLNQIKVYDGNTRINITEPTMEILKKVLNYLNDIIK